MNTMFVYSYQLQLTAARLKNGTAQGFRLANAAHIFFNFNWYDYMNAEDTVV